MPCSAGYSTVAGTRADRRNGMRSRLSFATNDMLLPASTIEFNRVYPAHLPEPGLERSLTASSNSKTLQSDR